MRTIFRIAAIIGLVGLGLAAAHGGHFAVRAKATAASHPGPRYIPVKGG